jgi:16S rRNA C1402 (ribose-2'-O) methylase RsmI
MLLLCATPIGNLGDLTPRVREALTTSTRSIARTHAER